MSAEKITKEMFHCKCDRPQCAYEWEPEKIPSRCPRCKSRRWNRPARLTTKALSFNGETHSIAEWTRKLGFSKTTIPWRIKQGWPMDQVLSNEDWRFQQP